MNYQSDEQVMTPTETAISLAQHREQHSIVALNDAIQNVRQGLDAAYDAGKAGDEKSMRKWLTYAWKNAQAAQANGVAQRQGFDSSMALNMTLADQVDRIVNQLLDTTLKPEDRMPIIQQFAEFVESQKHDEALDLMFENAAATMAKAPTWDISENDARVFIIFLLTGQLEASTFRVLGQMLPQLQDRMNAIGAAQK